MEKSDNKFFWLYTALHVHKMQNYPPAIFDLIALLFQFNFQMLLRRHRHIANAFCLPLRFLNSEIVKIYLEYSYREDGSMNIFNLLIE